RAVRTDRGGHSRARGAAPEGVSDRRHTKLIGIPEDVRDRSRQVLGCDPAALPRAVLEYEGVEAGPADLDCVWQTLVKRRDVSEPPTGRHHRERGAGLPRKEE